MSEAERPARHQRTSGGLIGALIVTVIVVLGFVGFRLLVFGEAPEAEIESIDYLPIVAEIQNTSPEFVYPEELPDGWKVTAIDFDPALTDSYGLNLFTSGEEFVGIRDEAAGVEEVLDDYVDSAAEPTGETYQAENSVVSDWEVFTDEGGDRAYVAESGERVVMVYGTAPAKDLEAVVEQLTTEPLGQP